MTRDVLITGGAGFIGSHLARHHLTSGDRVTVLDDLSTGTPANLPTDPRLTITEHDVREPYAALLHRPPAIIYNLASPASPVAYQRNPVKTWEANVLGVRNALAAAEHFGAVLVQASTSEVYGDPLTHPQPETYFGNVNPNGPRACYDESKRAAETLLLDHHRARGTRVKVARIFNTYGPNMQPDDGRVVTTFLRQAMMGEPLTVHGDGRQTRSFCYVTDLIDGLARLPDTLTDFTGPVNLGNPEEVTMLDLATLTLTLTGSRSRLRFLPAAADDPQRRCPDITLAHKRLGWRPLTSLYDGLTYTMEYMSAVLHPAA